MQQARVQEAWPRAGESGESVGPAALESCASVLPAWWVQLLVGVRFQFPASQALAQSPISFLPLPLLSDNPAGLRGSL